MRCSYRERNSAGVGIWASGRGSAGQAGDAVVLDEEMAVAGKDEGYVEPLTGGVEFGLLQAVGRGQVFGLGLDEGNRDRLRLGVHFDAQDVIHPSFSAPPGEPVNDVNCRGGFFAADEVFRPATGMDGRDR